MLVNVEHTITLRVSVDLNLRLISFLEFGLILNVYFLAFQSVAGVMSLLNTSTL